jgi:hypothetical protein
MLLMLRDDPVIEIYERAPTLRVRGHGISARLRAEKGPDPIAPGGLP